MLNSKPLSGYKTDESQKRSCIDEIIATAFVYSAFAKLSPHPFGEPLKVAVALTSIKVRIKAPEAEVY